MVFGIHIALSFMLYPQSIKVDRPVYSRKEKYIFWILMLVCALHSIICWSFLWLRANSSLPPPSMFKTIKQGIVMYLPARPFLFSIFTPNVYCPI